MTKKQGTTTRKQQSGISLGAALLFILAALFVQYVLKIDVGLEGEATATPQPTNAPAVATLPPAPTIAPAGTAIASAGALTTIPGGYDGGWFQVYFTTPINTTDESRFKDAPIENALVAAIDRAQQTLDAAVFELNSQPVTDALIRAAERGVRVRVVTDGEYGLEDPEATLDQLELADIPLVSDGSRSGLMHNKFFVIDGLYVWTGSTNITHNGMYNNNNNAMLIRSSRLAENFTAEFEEMFGGAFGKTSPNTIPNPVVTVEGTRIETLFESEGDVPARMIELFSAARSVRFMTFSFTRDDMFAPLIDLSQTGQLEAKGIVEASSRRFVGTLYCSNPEVRQDGNPDILHHKVFIIDESIVVMGSFNFTGNAADSNDENLLIIYNPLIARAYLEEFDRRWAESQPIPAGVFSCE